VAVCCKQNGHDFAALLTGDEVRKFRAFAIDIIVATDRGNIVESVLPYVDGKCRFLGNDNRCTIYEDRPQACRAFECVPQLNRFGVGKHGEFLQRNDWVRRMLLEM
jgi:Fe-S-cluster containining protein